MDKYVGKRLEGRYEIQELIGMGGMSNVYKAFDIIDQRTVAVKILRDEYLGNTEFLRRFKNESKAIAVLSHPNIVRVYDVSFTNRVHSIVMEYIDGITLKDYIERQSVLTWKEAVHFTLQILRALQHAHDKGIVHRDIKPQNIMLLQNGTIKVTDFGIARFARSEVKTITDRAIGSVHYISPEQAMGDNTDEKSDIYSVGVMLFEMLTGRLPFEADSAVSVALKQIQTQAAKPSSINPEIPPGLEDITIRAMQKDAARRYASAAEMISDIEQFKLDPSIHFEYKYLDNENEKARDKKIRRAIDKTRQEEVPMQRRRRTPYIPILTGVTLAFVMASFGFIGLMLYYNNPFVQVAEIPLPNLIGIKYETAAAQFDDFEIVAPEEEKVYSNEYSKGVIIEQKPKADTKIKVGSTVRVKVSLGPLVMQLPNFTGKDARQTLSRIRDLGLEPKEEKRYSAEVPAGCVIYTDPSKDSSVNSGAVITVYVSMGPERMPIEVEDVTGLKLEDAKTSLEEKLLRVGEVTEEPSDMPAGTVIAQDPPPGSYVDEGTPINLVISNESAKRVRISVQLPDVNRDILIRARVNEKPVAEETLNPKDVTDKTWRPTITGKEGEEVTVIIYIDKKRYQTIVVDIDMETQTIEEDRSDAAEFQ